MWNDIHPSEEWIDGNLPEVFSIPKRKKNMHIYLPTLEYFDV